VRGPRSPLVDHAEDHVLDQDNVNNIVVPTLNSTLSKIVHSGRIRSVRKRS